MSITGRIGGGARLSGNAFGSNRGVLTTVNIRVDSDIVRVDSETTLVDFDPAQAGPAGAIVRGGTRITAR